MARRRKQNEGNTLACGRRVLWGCLAIQIGRESKLYQHSLKRRRMNKQPAKRTFGATVESGGEVGPWFLIPMDSQVKGSLVMVLLSPRLMGRDSTWLTFNGDTQHSSTFLLISCCKLREGWCSFAITNELIIACKYFQSEIFSLYIPIVISKEIFNIIRYKGIVINKIKRYDE